jgi:mannosyltransferase OCH1-like enzyme
MNSWNQEMPDYALKCWNMNNIPKHHWIEEAVSVKKWAFASDYIRMYALYNEGGIYLDTDVFVKRRFDRFLGHTFFTAIEYNKKRFKLYKSADLIKQDGTKKNKSDVINGLTIQAGIIGSIAGHELLADIMKDYDKSHFIDKNGNNNYKLAPDVMALNMENHGFKYHNEFQNLSNNIIIYPTDIFASGVQTAVKNCYAIHMYNSEWKDYSFIAKIIRKLKKIVKIWLLKK